MWSILNLGLSFGYSALSLDASASGYSWWTGTPSEINGNWNCVCNGGLTLASLAIIDRDPTGMAAKVLALTVPSSRWYLGGDSKLLVLWHHGRCRDGLGVDDCLWR